MLRPRRRLRPEPAGSARPGRAKKVHRRSGYHRAPSASAATRRRVPSGRRPIAPRPSSAARGYSSTPQLLLPPTQPVVVFRGAAVPLHADARPLCRPVAALAAPSPSAPSPELGAPIARSASVARRPHGCRPAACGRIFHFRPRVYCNRGLPTTNLDKILALKPIEDPNPPNSPNQNLNPK